uniref:LysM peptidoglycan-binding domain-containing protein n=1 Tax=Salinicoccus albus TaxID=418756 RepID=UPI000363DCBE
MNQELVLGENSEDITQAVNDTAETESNEQQTEPTQSQAAGSDTYEVMPGDTLSKIASEFGTTYRALMEINGISDHLIHPGQLLSLVEEAPAEETVEAEEATVQETEAEPVQSENTEEATEEVPTEEPTQEAVTEE